LPALVAGGTAFEEDHEEGFSQIAAVPAVGSLLLHHFYDPFPAVESLTRRSEFGPRWPPEDSDAAGSRAFPLAKYDPKIRESRRREPVRKAPSRLSSPRGFELVYDNYNALRHRLRARTGARRSDVLVFLCRLSEVGHASSS